MGLGVTAAGLLSRGDERLRRRRRFDGALGDSSEAENSGGFFCFSFGKGCNRL